MSLNWRPHRANIIDPKSTSEGEHSAKYASNTKQCSSTHNTRLDYTLKSTTLARHHINIDSFTYHDLISVQLVLFPAFMVAHIQLYIFSSLLATKFCESLFDRKCITQLRSTTILMFLCSFALASSASLVNGNVVPAASSRYLNPIVTPSTTRNLDRTLALRSV